MYGRLKAHYKLNPTGEYVANSIQLQRESATAIFTKTTVRYSPKMPSIDIRHDFSAVRFLRVMSDISTWTAIKDECDGQQSKTATTTTDSFCFSYGHGDGTPRRVARITGTYMAATTVSDTITEIHTVIIPR